MCRPWCQAVDEHTSTICDTVLSEKTWVKGGKGFSFFATTFRSTGLGGGAGGTGMGAGDVWVVQARLRARV